MFTNQVGFSGFIQCGFHYLVGIDILSPNVHITLFGSNCISSDENPLQNTVGIIFHNYPVFESSGFRLIGIANQVVRILRFPGTAFPFDARWECCTSTPHQPGGFHFLDDRFRLHLQGFLYCQVPPILLILLQGSWMSFATIGCQNGNGSADFCPVTAAGSAYKVFIGAINDVVR